MATDIGEIGTGSSLSFDSSYFGKILNMTWTGPTRPSIEITHFASVAAREFMPGDVYDPGELAVEALCDPSTKIPPIGSGEEVDILLTFPNSGGGASSWKADGFMVDYSVTLPLEDKIVCNATIKFTDTLTPA